MLNTGLVGSGTSAIEVSLVFQVAVPELFHQPCQSLNKLFSICPVRAIATLAEALALKVLEHPAVIGLKIVIVALPAEVASIVPVKAKVPITAGVFVVAVL
jgi:hypothetical protein